MVIATSFRQAPLLSMPPASETMTWVSVTEAELKGVWGKLSHLRGLLRTSSQPNNIGWQLAEEYYFLAEFGSPQQIPDGEREVLEDGFGRLRADGGGGPLAHYYFMLNKIGMHHTPSAEDIALMKTDLGKRGMQARLVAQAHHRLRSIGISTEFPEGLEDRLRESLNSERHRGNAWEIALHHFYMQSLGMTNLLTPADEVILQNDLKLCREHPEIPTHTSREIVSVLLKLRRPATSQHEPMPPIKKLG